MGTHFLYPSLRPGGSLEALNLPVVPYPQVGTSCRQDEPGAGVVPDYGEFVPVEGNADQGRGGKGGAHGHLPPGRGADKMSALSLGAGGRGEPGLSGAWPVVTLGMRTSLGLGLARASGRAYAGGAHLTSGTRRP